MRRRGVWIVALASPMLAACGGNGADLGDGGLPTVRVVVSQGPERLVVMAEVAATEAQRSRGLMFREHVPAGTGMLFVYPGLVRRSFHMENTLVDLHILFIRDGRVVEIRNMRPCKTAPCPLTTPRSDYDSALEVGIGTLGKIQVGADVEIFGRLPEAA